MPTPIESLLDDIDSELRPPSIEWPERPLYHYTTSAGLLAILRTGTIWATDTRHLNDTSEIILGEDTVLEVAEEMRDAEEEDTGIHRTLTLFIDKYRRARLSDISNVFVASFSEEGNQLSQWRAYAGDGSGYSLGLNGTKLPTEEREDAIALSLYRCEYNISTFRRSVRSALGECLKKLGLLIAEHQSLFEENDDAFTQVVGRIQFWMLAKTATLVPSLKQDGFAEEKEWRLVALAPKERTPNVTEFRATARGVVPYLEIPLADDGERVQLDSIFVGPALAPVAGSLAVKHYLEKLGYDPDVVQPSGISYRP